MSSSTDNDSNLRFSGAWFIWINLSLLIFSFTLVVHVRNSFTSLRLLAKIPSDLLFWFGAVQSTAAIFCHISKMTDYFFTTNCSFKSIFNPTFYYISTTALAAVLYRRCYFSIRYGRHLFFAGAMVVFGMKLSGLVVLLSNFSPAPAVFRECKSMLMHIPSTIYFGIEICMNAYVMLWWLIILGDRVYLQDKPWRGAIRKDGSSYTLASTASTILFASLLMNGVVLGLSTDVLNQVQWAIQSMLCTQQLVEYYHDVKVILPTVNESLSTTACEMLQNRGSLEFSKGDTPSEETDQQSTSKSYQVLSRDMDIPT
ncbi:hypothetical protein K493DRAFT_301354 [Basidiobolus meristosporus CBS 931.73]|uniref:Uncharacterized protein n=1 Tax=Basidiobolus meristosporus CBS 931.73 TaxID=1314790 RepID=A0A1Y1YC97_9FUNG|nr:hypothetical protein K493DRAFT_301354 [Basidiobolus meristosporus CBS 931.73]|eukprot:ORX95619.1 hypothetical protein K493DRAFT_301354 [Basidiobolus meristosporus CBS 931.73]